VKSLDPLAGVTVFLHLAELLSFSATASRLGLSRATVSAQLSELERRLGVRLLQRSSRHISLTEAGGAYRDTLAGLLAQVTEAERVASAFQREPVGRLKVTAPVEIGQRYIIPALSVLLARQPQLVVELDLTSTPVDLVAAGYDLAIRATISEAPNHVVRKLGTSPMRVAAAPDYLASRPPPARPEDLAVHDCLNLSGLRWGQRWVMTGEGGECTVQVSPRLAVNDGEALRRAAVAGLGVALLPMFLIGDDLRAGRLVPLLSDWTVPAVPVNAVYPARRHIAAKVRAFVDLLARALAVEPDFGAAP
jgi:DNA-binding transcriptional LysR family regulator